MVSLRKWVGISGACLGAFMACLDASVTSASLKVIQGALGASMDEATWISSSYRIAELIVVPVTPWLARILSTRLYMLASAILFVLCSAGCASATDFSTLVIMRIMQGLTGGALIPLALTAIFTELPDESRPTGMAVYGLIASLAPTAGPWVGGWITDNCGWQYLFYINFLPGIAMSLAIWWGLSGQPFDLDGLRKGDWCGILSLAIFLGSLEVVLEEGTRLNWWGSPLIVCLAIVAGVFFLAWLFIELTIPSPFVKLRLLHGRSFAAANIIGFTTYLAISGSYYVLSVCLQEVQNFSPGQVGSVIMWGGSMQLIMAPLAVWLMKRFDDRLLLFLGCAGFAGSALMNAQMTNLTGLDQLVLSQAVRGVAQPLITITLSSVALRTIDRADGGNASALYTMIRYLGSSIGVSLSTEFIQWREHLHSQRLGAFVQFNSPKTQARLAQMTEYFMSLGVDPTAAARQALSLLGKIVRRESYIMAFADAFAFIALVVLLVGASVCLCVSKKPQPEKIERNSLPQAT